MFDQEIEIAPGQTSVKLDIPYGNIFDGEINLMTEYNQKDVIYLADGSWGLDYDSQSTIVDKYDILSDNRRAVDNAYLVERGISVSGTTDSYLSIFKQLKPGGMPVDLSEYNTLSFDSEREGVYEITLLTDQLNNISKKLSHTLRTESGSAVDIPFILFSNEENERLDPSKITTIYIAFTEANNEQSDFDFTIENIRFRNDEGSDFVVEPDKLNIFPNPSSGLVQITHNFKQNTDVQITVSDTKGSIIKQTRTQAYKGLQNFDIELEGNNEPGIYLISIYTNHGIFSNTLLLKK